MDFVTSDDKRTKYGYVLEQQGYDTSRQRNQDIDANYAPTEHIRNPVDKEAVLRLSLIHI